MIPLAGRQREVKRFKELLRSRKSEFVAVYGRRRVGKTFLIRSIFESQFAFQLTGMANAKMPSQLGQFRNALTNYAPDMERLPSPKDWFEAFQQLIEYLKALPKKNKKVIFLDELPWLDSQNSRFISALEHFWNAWASARKDILLIVCGSAASWMLNQVIRNRGGLHNRITEAIKLSPFSLREAEEFLHQKGAVYDRYQMLLLYMAFGGIPYYLDRIDPGLSAMQNINALCFEQNATFRSEFENLYASLFNKHSRHISIIQALGTKAKGLSRDEIVTRSKMSNGGGLSRILEELEESGFIRRYRAMGKKERDSLYQLVDLYSLFHLRFIRRSSKDDTNFWINAIESPAFNTWGGYAFEMVCLLHVSQIKNALGISGVQTSVYSWQSKEAQVDLLIDRKDQVINLCEMKFSINSFSIDKKYAESLRKKIGTFKNQTGTRKSLFLTMITTFGLAENKYSGLVRNSLDMQVLFEK